MSEVTISVRALSNVQNCAAFARLTQGLGYSLVSLEAWKSWLKAEHSMIRALILEVSMKNIPYFVSVHFVRHKVGVEHFVRSQRDTAMRPVNYDRRKAPQDALVDHTMVLNPQVLINISRRRLCNKADPVTQAVWWRVREAVEEHDDPYVAAIAEVMVPNCVYRGSCFEIKSCGKRK